MPITTAARFRGLFLIIGILVGSTPLFRDQPDQPAGTRADEMQLLRLESERLGKQYELATGNAFYLLVDPSAAELTLAYRGVPLRRYPILDARVGVPRVAFIDWGGDRGNGTGIIWSGGRLDPERPSDRVEIKVSSPDSASEPPAPPEVAVPVPATYFLRYEPGLAIAIERSSADSNAAWRRLLARWRTRGREVRAALSLSQQRALRLRLVLKSADADSLYRSLPPDTRLLIVPVSSIRQESSSGSPSPTPAPRATPPTLQRSTPAF